MVIKNYLKILILSLIIVCCNLKEKQKNTVKNLEYDITKTADTIKSTPFDNWKEGFLDIHHINTGSGDTSFMILPDGTTMLFDTGELNKKVFEERHPPMKIAERKPDSTITVSEWVSLYIKTITPKEITPKIDYAVVSHFHRDHYGSLMDLGNKMSIKKIIDRDAPGYNFPLDVKQYLKEDKNFQKYLSFIDSTGVPVEALKVGVDNQIKLLNSSKEYPSFKIRNVKSNATIWTGKGEGTFDYFTAKDMTNYYKGKYNENPLSLALKISYGKFDYFTGGDNTGLQGFGLPYWFDVETPMAKAVGKVEVTTLNHHGNRDATNEFFVKTLDPKVVVQQSWCSDHPGQEVYQRLIYKDKNAESRDIFATNMHDETKVTYGPWFIDNYKSMQGHIVVRVYPRGNKYEVIILNDDSTELTVKRR